MHTSLTEIGALLTTLIAAAGVIIRGYQKRIEAIEAKAIANATATVRAEVYREEATRTIEEMNRELSQVKARNAELEASLARMTNHEVPRLQDRIDGLQEIIINLTGSPGTEDSR